MNFKQLLKEIAKEIRKGEVWYGRLYCPSIPEYEDSMWLKMSDKDLPMHWEYKKKGSDIVIRQDTDENKEGCLDCMCEECNKYETEKCEITYLLRNVEN